MSGTRSLGNMVVRLGVALEQYKADWAEAVAKTEAGAKDVDEAVKKAEKSLDKLGETAEKTGAAVGTAVAAAAAGIVLLVKSSIDQADAIGKLAEKTGIATETLSAYQYAASLSDVSTETLSTSMRALSRNVADNSPVMERMGVATRDNAGNLRSLDAVMGDVADKFAGYTDGAGKAALAQEVFGRGGVDMINMLNEGSVGLENMRLEAAKLGVVVSTETSAAAAQFNDNMTRLKAVSTGYLNHMVAGLLPVLVAATKDMGNAAAGAHDMDGGFSAVTETVRALIVVGGNVGYVLKGIATEIGGLAAQAAAIGRGDFAGAMEIGRAMKADAAAARSAIDTWTQGVLEAKKTVKTIKEEMTKVDPPTKPPKVDRVRRTGPTEEEKQAERQRKLLAELSGVQADYNQKLTDLNKLRESGNISEARYVELVTELIAKQPMARALMQDAAKATAEKAKAVSEAEKADRAAAKAFEDRLKVMADGIGKQEEELEKLREHNAALGLSKTAVAELTAAKLEEQAASIEGRAIRLGEMEAQQAVIDLMFREAALRRAKAQEVRAGAAKETELDTANAALKENERMWDSIDRTAHDVLVNIGEGGEATFKKLGQVLKASVLDLLYQLTVRKFFINIGAQFSGSNAANVAGVASGGGSSSMGMLGNVGAMISGSGAVGAGLMTGLGSWAGGLSGVGGAISAGGSLLAGGSIAGGLGMLAGALGPVAIALGVIAMMAKKGGGPKTEAGYAPGGLNIGGIDIGGNMQGSQRGDVSAAQKISEGISKNFAQLASTFDLMGKKLDVGVFYAMDNAKGGTSKTQLQVTSSAGYNRSDRVGGIENVARGEEALQSTLAEEAVRVLIDGLRQAVDLGQQYKDVLSGISDNAGLEEMQAALERITNARNEEMQLQEQLFQLTHNDSEKLLRLREQERAALDPLNAALLETVYAAQDAATSLAEKTALEDSLLAATGNEIEQLARTRERERAAVLPANAAILEQVYAQEDLAKATQRASAVANERAGLERQIMQLLGDTNGLRQLELAGLHESNRARQQYLYDLQDEQAAQVEAQRAIEQASQSAAQALQQSAQAMQEAQQYIAGFTTNIGGWLDRLDATPVGLGTPEEQLAAAQTQFDRQYALAQSGDRDAMSGITGYADQLIEANKAYSGSGGDTMATIDRIRQLLGALPGQISAEQLIVNAVTAIGSQITGYVISSGAGIVSAIDAMRTDVTNRLATDFATLDTTLDNQLNFEEFYAGMSGLGTHDDLMTIFMELDTNHDGQLTQLELLRQSVMSVGDAITDRLQFDFAKLDTTLDGQVGFEEFLAGMNDLGTSAELADLFRKLDTNSDGQLSQLEAIKGSTGSTAVDTSGGVVPTLLALHSDVGIALNGIAWQIGHYGDGAHQDLAAIYGRLAGVLDVRSENRSGSSWPTFSQGGVFTNGIVSQSTMFNMAEMGEAGPEAIMPLVNGPGGLGVRTYGASGGRTQAVIYVMRPDGTVYDASRPSFDGGSDVVPNDMAARSHRGERSVTAAENRSGGGESRAMLSELRDALAQANGVQLTIVTSDRREIARYTAKELLELSRRGVKVIHADGVIA